MGKRGCMEIVNAEQNYPFSCSLDWHTIHRENWKRFVVNISCFLTGKEVYSQFRTNWSAIYLFANNFTICLDIWPYFFGLKQLQYCIWAVIYTRVFLIKLRNLSSCVTICKYRSWNSVTLHACWSQVHCTPVFLNLGNSSKGSHAQG